MAGVPAVVVGFWAYVVGVLIGVDIGVVVEVFTAVVP